MRTEINVRVYFEDTDFTGVVYHANYLKFFERGRSEALRSAGFDHRTMLDAANPLAFTVHTLTVKYARPARIDDLLTVITDIKSVKGARMVFEQMIKRDDETLAEAEIVVACMDLQGRPRRIPKEIVAACGS
ncbi:MAG: tol-pal system-associated acyl-CoA thioesterase [Parvularcula sp.]